VQKGGDFEMGEFIAFGGAIPGRHAATHASFL
jgi:hypothetical protein